ncbi:MAG: undecaprenyl-diphosphate phosphatase [Alphaproteobacteria bacterium]
MSLETWLHAAFLGLLEGLTEFIPVSSTGHLIAFVDILGFQGPPGRVFEVSIQLGAIFAVCVAYRMKLAAVIAGLVAGRGEAWRFSLAVLAAFVPAAVMGALFHSAIKGVLFNPTVVATALVVGGIAILAIEKVKPAATIHEIERFPILIAFLIGVAQALALVPGVSRSGATIMSALLLRVDRKAATEFSFFLSIPTMLGATVYDLYKNRATLTFDGAALIAVGFIAAFLAAIVTVRWVIGFVSRHGFAAFAWYRIALGLGMLALIVGF